MTTITPLEQATADFLTRKTLDHLDKLADAWAERVDLPATVARIVNSPEAVAVMMRQAYEEGAYEGRVESDAGAAAVESIALWLEHLADGWAKQSCDPTNSVTATFRDLAKDIRDGKWKRGEHVAGAGDD